MIGIQDALVGFQNLELSSFCVFLYFLKVRFIVVLKVNGYSFRKSYLPFSFFLPSQYNQVLKERNYSLSLIVDLIFSKVWVVQGSYKSCPIGFSNI